MILPAKRAIGDLFRGLGADNVENGAKFAAFSYKDSGGYLIGDFSRPAYIGDQVDATQSASPYQQICTVQQAANRDVSPERCVAIFS